MAKIKKTIKKLTEIKKVSKQEHTEEELCIIKKYKSGRTFAWISKRYNISMNDLQKLIKDTDEK